MTYFIRDEYTHKRRQRLTIWSGAFASDYEGRAVELPKHNGFMVAIGGQKIRVECPSPRTNENYLVVDQAINQAIIRDRLEYLRSELRAERISYGELAELQGLADEIQPGDVELAEAAGIPEEEFAKRG
jgi:hypothetical protein